MGFFPFERRRFGVGVPLGAGMNDCQGLPHPRAGTGVGSTGIASGVPGLSCGSSTIWSKASGPLGGLRAWDGALPRD